MRGKRFSLGRRTLLIILTSAVCAGCSGAGWDITVAPKQTNESGSKVGPIIIAGLWGSNIGLHYDISQNGNHFTWKVIGKQQTASGTLTGNSVSAAWSGGGPPGSATGTIVAVNGNAASKIKWSNGVVFYR